MTTCAGPSRKKKMSHDRILDVAARAVCREGFAAVGIANVMKEAGLTHGGFYAHFDSREEMLAEALEHAGKANAAALTQRIASRCAQGDSPFRALVETYLAERHLGSTESGCPVAALGSEMPRQSSELREGACRTIQGLVKLVQQALVSKATPETATVIAGTVVGTLQLARTLGSNEQGKALLDAIRKTLLSQYDGNANAAFRVEK